MKLSKSLPDSMRHTLVKASSAIFEPVETILEKSGKTQKAQKLRKLQHQYIGLSEDQWQYINDYFENEEFLYLILQARDQELQTYKKMKSEEPPSDDPNEMNNYKEKLRESERKLEEYNNDVRSTEGVKKLLKWKMGHTPLYRAMDSQRRDANWGKRIGVVASDFVALGQVNLISREGKRYMHSKISYSGRVKFNPRKEETDEISARLMNAYVWGLDGRRG
ncbi:hypothetical protein BO85DRAFT_508560 [Aspergillus piperis CBS 112811]|uniref:Uncharacterized protein n=1 Tax=Aspergillus piperis CBS 112811 TaxID=1448313 RepID=A0A8G1QQC1_9EURO|nr:hypothetical protein BO85DRAFT_508560 [Aspergillus piperis CBS 112811]RAH51883.1 hypothetical protein BO85DRAFT_508560 [Aspergillus piperis CBS 112811]